MGIWVHACVCITPILHAADELLSVRVKVPDMRRANSSSSETRQDRKHKSLNLFFRLLREGLGLLTTEQWATVELIT